jgi:glycine amidinotransferase/scyllo-inosamine-4-phosphate amidinotransferase 1
MRLSSHNEWSPLQTVVVGTVEGFSPGIEGPPTMDLDQAVRVASEAFPRWYLDEVGEDLEGLCDIFRRANVTVLRPRWTEASAHFRTPNWVASGYDIYNVRDLHIVFGNTLVASAPSSRFRLFESYALRELFYEHFFDDGFRWITAPPPKLRGEYVHEVNQPRTELQHREDSLHQQLSHGLREVFHYLDNDEIIFDAANIIRLGEDILFLVSSTGNRKAIKWLGDVLGAGYRVHETHSYRSSHLDSTILPLRPGTVLLNGARVNRDTCPAVLKSWDQLYFTDVAPVPEEEVAFHQKVRLPVFERLKAIGVASTLNHISSPWAGLNVMSIDPQTVLVHDRQVGMIRMLEAKGFTVVPVRMRHCYSMLGGLHCTTLDVMRASEG